MNLRNIIIFSGFLLTFLLISNLVVSNNKLPKIKYAYQQNSHRQIFTPESDIRSLDQTLLTFPEWYLVYNPEEFASFIKKETPDKFPFYRSIWQYWDSYLIVSKYANQIGSDNFGYHIMLIVIGSSTTVEYLFRGLYENSIGKLTAYLAGRSAEDDYAANVATQYAEFINLYPWYEFDFAKALVNLWKLPLFGENFIRKIERRYILTTEYSIKYIYAKLIAILTQSSYGVAKLYTVAVIDKSPSTIKDLPQYKLIEEIDNANIVQMPRYDAFKNYALELAKQDINFFEIAGNRTFIAISIITNSNFNCTQCQILFKQEIYTNPSYQRIFIIVPVNQLSKLLHESLSQPYRIEHIYDY